MLGTLLKLFKGLSFDEIAKSIGKDEVWLAAAFYGQVSKKSGKGAIFRLSELRQGQVF